MAQKKNSKIDIKQKKEVLKEVLTVMKFTVFQNEPSSSDSEHIPYAGYIYLMDE